MSNSLRDVVTWLTADRSRYHLFLLISVLLIFLLTSTYWALVRDLVDTPMKVSLTLLEYG